METVGVIGLGIMGGAMARNIAASGSPVVGYDPSADASRRLVEGGGEALDSVQAVAERAEVIVTSLATHTAFDAVMEALAGACGPRHVIVDTSTMEVAVKQAAHDRLATAGAAMLDCPVSGTGAQAAVKDLVAYASGEREAFERALPALQGFSRRQAYLGPFGNGSTMKFIANLLVNIHNVATAEALVLAQRAGLDLHLVLDTIADGAGGSRMFQVRGPLMVAGKYDEPTARIDMYMKDLDIISRFAAGLHAPTPLFSAATQLYHAAQRQGLGSKDLAAVCLVLEGLAGITRKPPPPTEAP